MERAICKNTSHVHISGIAFLQEMARSAIVTMPVQVDGVMEVFGGHNVVGHARARNVTENTAVVMLKSVKVVDVIAIHADLEQGMDR